MRCVSTFTSVLGNLRSSTTDNYILFLSYSLASDCWTLLSELGGFRRRCSDPPSLKRRRTETSLSLYIFKHIRTSTLYTSVLCTIYIYMYMIPYCTLSSISRSFASVFLRTKTPRVPERRVCTRDREARTKYFIFTSYLRINKCVIQ